jgi:outer membrane protein OmpA-like peptidoglycan-associated protein
MTTITLLLSLMPALLPTAQAQDAQRNAHNFYPATLDSDLKDLIIVQRPGSFVAGDVTMSSLLEYTTIQTSSLTGDDAAPSLSDLFALNASYSIAIHDHVRLSVGVPVYFTFQSESVTTAAPYGRTPLTYGDTRLSAMFILVRPKHIVGASGLGVGLNTHLDLPTGDQERWLGNPGKSGGFAFASSYEYGVATVTGNLGYQFNPQVDGDGEYTAGNAPIFGAGFGIQYHPFLSINAEVASSGPYTPKDVSSIAAESVLSMRFQRESGLHWVLGAASRLGSADAPAQRFFLGLGGFAGTPPTPDTDSISTFASNDNCPTEPETHNDWLDDDGCPDELSSLAISVHRSGHPAPGARIEITGPEGTTVHIATSAPIGIPEAMPGSTWRAQASLGACLTGWSQTEAAEGGVELVVDLQRLDGQVKFEVVDADGALLPDATVTFTSDDIACIPTTPQPLPSGTAMFSIGVGDHLATITAPGHKIVQIPVTADALEETLIRLTLEPSLVQLEEDRITITERVHFETGKSIIKPESYALLNEVAQVVVDHQDIGRIQVAGHTDSKGSDAANLRLSQGRASAVQSFLINAGVNRDRLISAGFGEAQPIDTNLTNAGRANNRRVEFNLIDQVK